jgi:hypothetical protein
MPHADEFTVNRQLKNMSDFIKKIEDKLEQVERISNQRITSLERRLASNIPVGDLLDLGSKKRKKKKSVKRKKKSGNKSSRRRSRSKRR